MQKAVLLTSLFLLFCFTASSQAQDEDKSLSPYFVVKSASGQADHMPLKHTAAEVNIAGVIAEVVVTQVYQNEGKIPLEATYVFPASTRAAVFAMEMQVGERRIRAQIKEKQAARQLYNAARAAGQTASLLEQDRPNIFSMQVANILPGDSIVVQLSYTELLRPEQGVYEFVYPTVVGPRYTGPQGDPSTPSAVLPTRQVLPQSSGIPTTKEGIAPAYSFDLKATVSAGMTIPEINSPSHQVRVRYRDDDAVQVSLEPGEQKKGDRDFVLRYRLTGEDIRPGLITYEEAGEKFFLLMMQPPKVIAPEKSPPKEYVFVVDVSGSMGGFPLNTAKLLMTNLLKTLDANDRFNILLFAGGSRSLAPQSLSVTPNNIERARSFLLNSTGGGGTNMYSAIDKALKLQGTQDYSRHVVVVTDGYISAEAKVFDLVRQHLGQINVWSFGIGSSVNRHLIEGLAHVGQGEPLVVLNMTEVEEPVKRFQQYIASPALTNVLLDFGESVVYDVEPSYIPDVMAERPILIMGKYRGELAGQWKVSGDAGKDSWTGVVSLDEKAKPQPHHRALRYLWARERIRLLGDYAQFGKDSSHIAEVTDLGLTYNLLTDYTSFVAVDERVRNAEGEDKSVTQPVPLPAGVGNESVAQEEIRIRGASTNASAYYIDGQKIRGASNLQLSSSVAGVSIQECVVIGYGRPIYEADAVSGSVVSYTSSAHTPADFGFVTDFAAQQQGASSLSINGFSVFPGVGNYFHTQNIPQLWLSSATLYPVGTSQTHGYDALYGGVNLNLFNASENTFKAEVSGDQFGQARVSALGVHKFSDDLSTRIFADLGAFNRSIDQNEDGFQDAEKTAFSHLLNIWDGTHFNRKLRWEAGGYMHRQNRTGGELIDVIEASLDSFRWDWNSLQLAAFGQLSWEIASGHKLKFKTNLSSNTSDAFFGPSLYAGSQRFFESQLLYQKEFQLRNGYVDLLGGVIYRNISTQESYQQVNLDRQEEVPAALVGLRFQYDQFFFTGNLRLDRHNLYGDLLHPDATLSYRGRSLQLLGSVYRGTRPANLLSENLRFMPSARVFTGLVTEFVPDQAWKYHAKVAFTRKNKKISFESSFSYTYSRINSMMLANMGSFFENVSFFASPNPIDRHDWLGHMRLKVWNQVGFDFRLTGNNFFIASNRRFPFMPSSRGYLTLFYQSKHKDQIVPWYASVSLLTVGQQFNFYGDIFEPISQSWRPYTDPFFTINFDLRRRFKKIEIFGGVENILNYRQLELVQSSELTGANFLDAGAVWAPALGRRIHAGIGLNLTK